MPRKTSTAKQPVYIFTYTNKTLKTFAKTYGKKEFGSESAYVNHLIEQDRKRFVQRVKAA